MSDKLLLGIVVEHPLLVSGIGRVKEREAVKSQAKTWAVSHVVAKSKPRIRRKGMVRTARHWITVGIWTWRKLVWRVIRRVDGRLLIGRSWVWRWLWVCRCWWLLIGSGRVGGWLGVSRCWWLLIDRDWVGRWLGKSRCWWLLIGRRGVGWWWLVSRSWIRRWLLIRGSRVGWWRLVGRC